ncbi:MAG: helix-turn-helix domain-containing protein [Paludibacteraceae bacterium]|nr:helix-turn-helix domain-containing protein [Paludibacteraceae bacterium]
MDSIIVITRQELEVLIRDQVINALDADRAKSKPVKTYTREQVCEMAHITLPTLWAKTKRGDINSMKIGGRVLYSEDEVKRFLGQL